MHILILIHNGLIVMVLLSIIMVLNRNSMFVLMLAPNANIFHTKARFHVALKHVFSTNHD